MPSGRRLSSLVVYRNGTESRGFKNRLDVGLRSAGDTCVDSHNRDSIGFPRGETDGMAEVFGHSSGASMTR